MPERKFQLTEKQVGELWRADDACGDADTTIRSVWLVLVLMIQLALVDLRQLFPVPKPEPLLAQPTPAKPPRPLTTWLRRAGSHAKRLHGRLFRNLQLLEIQLDELRTTLRDKGQEVWVWIACDAQTKVIAAVQMGPRTQHHPIKPLSKEVHAKRVRAELSKPVQRIANCFRQDHRAYLLV